LYRLPGSLLFTAGAILLVIQGDLGVVNLLAVLFTAVCAVFALTKRHLWALVGGVIMISTSVTMQIAMGYWCTTCLKADLLLLAAVIALAAVQKGRVKLPSRIMAGAVSIVLVAVLIMITPVSMNASPVSSSEEMGDEMVVLDEEKPALLIKPSCDSCSGIIDKNSEDMWTDCDEITKHKAQITNKTLR